MMLKFMEYNDVSLEKCEMVRNSSLPWLQG